MSAWRWLHSAWCDGVVELVAQDLLVASLLLSASWQLSHIPDQWEYDVQVVDSFPWP